jgi:membrane-bound lytic murein transglycosylase MltF
MQIDIIRRPLPAPSRSPQPDPAPLATCDRVTLGSVAPLDLRRPRVDPLETHWGEGPNENKYNRVIAWAVSDRWGSYQPALPPLLLKSLIAQESSFDPNCVSESGYAGLTQISKEEALGEGLEVEPHDERFVPRKNVHAGVGVLLGKMDVMLHPETIADDYPFAKKVVEAYGKFGRPEGRNQWMLALGAYNGGQGTVMRAMARAYDRNLDPVDWSNLIQPRDKPEESPLYGATLEVFGPDRALAKYREISKYPIQIMARYEPRQDRLETGSAQGRGAAAQLG